LLSYDKECPEGLEIKWYTSAFALCRSTHTIKKYTDALVVARKEIDPQVHAVKTKYMDMSSDQTASQNYNIKIDNTSLQEKPFFLR